MRVLNPDFEKYKDEYWSVNMCSRYLTQKSPLNKNVLYILFCFNNYILSSNRFNFQMDLLDIRKFIVICEYSRENVILLC